MLSVIMPVYNVENYVEKSIESVLNQVYKDFELLIINDGSTDGSLGICEKYAEQDCRVRIISQKNQGLSAARNKGLKEAKGEFVAFIDSDDYIHPQMYKMLMEELQKNHTDLAMCNFQKVEENIKVDERLDFAAPISIFQQEECYMHFFDNLGTVLVISWNKIYKKTLFDNLEFPVGKIYEDAHIMHLLYEKCNSVVFVDAPLYYYLQRPNSIMSNKNKIRRTDAIEAYMKWFEFFKKQNYVEFAEKSAYKVQAMIMEVYRDVFPQYELCKRVRQYEKMYKEMFCTIFHSKQFSVKFKMKSIIFYIVSSIYG